MFSTAQFFHCSRVRRVTSDVKATQALYRQNSAKAQLFRSRLKWIAASIALHSQKRPTVGACYRLSVKPAIRNICVLSPASRAH
jgi:uncharacterized protein YegL